MAKVILYLENKEPIENPTPEDIKTELNNLNGAEYTVLELTFIGKGTLMAIGGNGGKIMVTYIPENPENDSPSLVDKNQSIEEEYELTFEGEPTLYSAKFCVTCNFAQKAFEEFMISGALSKKYTWENA